MSVTVQALVAYIYCPDGRVRWTAVILDGPFKDRIVKTWAGRVGYSMIKELY